MGWNQTCDDLSKQVDATTPPAAGEPGAGRGSEAGSPASPAGESASASAQGGSSPSGSAPGTSSSSSSSGAGTPGGSAAHGSYSQPAPGSAPLAPHPAAPTPAPPPLTPSTGSLGDQLGSAGVLGNFKNSVTAVSKGWHELLSPMPPAANTNLTPAQQNIQTAQNVAKTIRLVQQ